MKVSFERLLMVFKGIYPSTGRESADGHTELVKQVQLLTSLALGREVEASEEIASVNDELRSECKIRFLGSDG